MAISSTETAVPRWRILLAFAAIYLIWGSTYLGIRIAIDTIPPFLMAGSRFILAGGALYIWLRLRGAPKPRAIHWRSAAIIGGLMLVGGNGGVTWAEQFVPSGLAALMIASVSFWIVLLDWFRPGGVRPAAGTTIGLLVGFIGVGLLVGNGNIRTDSGMSILGAAVLILAALSWAAGSVYSRVAELPHAPPLLGTAMEMLSGGILLVVVATMSGDWVRLDLASISALSVLAFIYLTIFGSMVGFSAYIFLLRTTTPARAATYSYVNPVVAVFLGWAFGNEPLTQNTLVAAGIIIAGVVIITTYKGRRMAALAESS